MSNKKLDFKGLNAAALRQSDAVAQHYAPNGKRSGREYVATNPSRNDKTARSFSLNLDTGVWSDFSTDAKGGDLISFVAQCRFNNNMGDAYKDLAQFVGFDTGANSAPPRPPESEGKAKYAPIFPPPPEAAQSCFVRHPTKELGKPSVYWDYLSEGGDLLMRVCRFDRTKSDGTREKEYRPVTYGVRNVKGRERTGWHWCQLPSDRPLFGLEQLTKLGGAGSAGRALIVEGEKACIAARELFPNIPVLSWSSGAKAISKTNWSPLAGREVWYWRDNDDPGQGSIEPLRKILIDVGALAFRVLDLSVFNRFKPTQTNDGSQLIEASSEWPEGADAFDAVEVGWRAEYFTQLEFAGVLLLPREVKDITTTASNTRGKAPPSTADKAPPKNEPPKELFSGFKVDDGGVYAFDAKTNSYNLNRPICARLDILAHSRDGGGTGRGWGLLVEFKDRDGVLKQWNIPMQLFGGDGAPEIVRGLLDRGLRIDHHREAKRKIIDYLQAQADEVKARVQVVQKMGWHKIRSSDRAFILPEKTYGNPTEKIIFDGDGTPPCKIIARGSLLEWQNQVAAFCVGNPLALFAVSSAFTGPLLDLLEEEIMGFHFFGDSSLGKSTLLNVASSVLGNPDEFKNTWRTTSTALEGIAAAHSDMLLCLDEINQCDEKIIGEVVYLLGNGRGRLRANERAQVKDARAWCLTFLSNGERTLEHYMAGANKELTGGMEMRFIGIGASLHDDEQAQKKWGCFNTGHGIENGAALSEYFRRTMSDQHGTAFPAFLEALFKELGGSSGPTLIKRIREGMERFKSENLKDKGGQVDRAAKKFALVGIAGELATIWGVTGWPQGSAIDAATELFKRWLGARGGEGNMEEKQILDHLRAIFQANKESKFKRFDVPLDGISTVIDSHVPAVSECWGHRVYVVDKDALEGDSSALEFFVDPIIFKKVICKGIDHKRAANLLLKIGALRLTDSSKKEGRLVIKKKLPDTGKNGGWVYHIDFASLMRVEAA